MQRIPLGGRQGTNSTIRMLSERQPAKTELARVVFREGFLRKYAIIGAARPWRNWHTQQVEGLCRKAWRFKSSRAHLRISHIASIPKSKDGHGVSVLRFRAISLCPPQPGINLYDQCAIRAGGQRAYTISWQAQWHSSCMQSSPSLWWSASLPGSPAAITRPGKAGFLLLFLTSPVQIVLPAACRFAERLPQLLIRLRSRPGS